jgi:flagellar protein FlbB
MGTVQYIAKTVVLLILVIVMIFGGLIWFDYLGVFELKQTFAPVYRLIGLQTQTSVSLNAQNPFVSDLDDDRLARRLEAFDMRGEELDKREADIVVVATLNDQVAKELEERKISQEEREKTFNNEVKKYDDRMVNIEQNARNLTGMPPQNAVNILLAMDDQNVIDTLRKVEEIAQAEGASSMVAYWLSLMPADRAATLQRKVLEKPTALN